MTERDLNRLLERICWLYQTQRLEADDLPVSPGEVDNTVEEVVLDHLDGLYEDPSGDEPDLDAWYARREHALTGGTTIGRLECLLQYLTGEELLDQMDLILYGRRLTPCGALAGIFEEDAA
jgi:hypothetical protein